MRPRTRSTHGLTLIELLVVVAILVILAGLLLPVVGKMRGLQAKTTCLSNMRQIGIAMNLYASDHNLELPPKYDPVKGGPAWQDYLNDYLGLKPFPQDRYFSAPIWWCPAVKKIDKWTRHYAMNVYIYDTSSNAKWHRKLLAIPAPSKYVVMGETNANGEILPVHLAANYPPDYTGQVPSIFRISHANKSANYLFADWHVENRIGIQTADTGQDSIWRWW